MTVPWFRQIAHKGLVHWLFVILTVSLGLYVGHLISDARLWLEWRYGASHAIQQLGPREAVVKYTTIVTIGSREYWTSPLAARAPVNRGYLADLVEAIARGNPFLIALDFDLRSPQPDGSVVEIPEFASETRRLIERLRVIARDRHVVLPRTIWNAAGPKRYRLDSDVWNLVPGLLEEPNVGSGYIALPPDLRQVPLAVHLEKASEPLDSFSLAIARARAEHVTDLLAKAGGRKDLPYASFIPEAEFPRHSAGEVLHADPADLRNWFNGRLVLIGGEWSVLASGRGPRVDSYLTPAGVMPGVFIHANFVEALLDQRTFEPAPEGFVAILEIAMVLVCVAAFGLEVTNRVKAAICMLAFAFLILVNYVALQNLGRFFDFSIPLGIVVLHVAFEQIGQWRHRAREHRRCSAQMAVLLLTTIAITSAPLAPSVVSGQVRDDAPQRRDRLDRPAQAVDPSSQPVYPMGPRPEVREDVESADPAKPGGPRNENIEKDRPIDTMGPGPVVDADKEVVEPGQPGGPRHDGDPIDQELY